MTSLLRAVFHHVRILAISLTVFSIPASAAYTDKMAGSWMISQGDKKCTLVTRYESNTVIRFDLIWFDETATFWAWNKNWSALRDKEDVGVDVEINFQGNVEYDEFWQKPATVIVIPATENESGFNGIVAGWNKEDSENLLLSLAMSSGFSLMVENKLIGSFDSKDTLQAVKELYKCTADGRTHSGQDPFAE